MPRLWRKAMVIIMPYELLISVTLFVYGTIIGSFLNVVIYRIPKKEQIVKGRSHCMSCGHTLGLFDLFPVLSWIFLRGKCRYCKSRISGRYALVESLCGLSYVAAFLLLGITVKLAFAVVLFPILLCLSFYDIDTGEIEYWCPISIALLGLTALGFSLFDVIGTSWYEHLIGAFIISVPFAVLLFFGAMGGADVQLMAAAGLLLGWNVIPAALIGIFLGSIFGVIFKIINKPAPESVYGETEILGGQAAENETEETESLPKGTVIRFGPFLAVGIAVGFVYGEKLIDFYMSFMG